MRIFFALLLSLSAHAGTWDAAEKLATDQKFEAALEETKSVLAGARKQGDEALITEGLLRTTRLEIALHGFETAVRNLKEAPWPKDATDRVLLELYYGYSLMTYQQHYGWEIAKREKTASNKTVDLKALTTQEIGLEISRSFDNAMKDGAWLDKPVPAFFRAYITANNYPEGVRPTLRDTITYLAVEHMQNQQFWSAAASNELFKLSASKLGEHPPGERIPAANAAAHPVERIASWLGELEKVHEKHGRKEAALEARYVLFSALSSAFSTDDDKSAVLAGLAAFQKNAPKIEWWARGQALLAEFLRQSSSPGRLVKARAEAISGRDAFKGSVGAAMCQAILFEIERPELAVQAMDNDGAEKRSVMLNYRNVRKAYFRAYPVDVEAALRDSRGNGFLTFDADKLRRTLTSKEPAAAWSADLAETKDYVTHRDFVSPPKLASGVYDIVVSLRSDFGPNDNLVHAVTLFVSDLVITSRAVGNGTLEVRALSGESGKPVAGAKVQLYRFNWKGPAEIAKTETSGEDGYVIFKTPANAGNEYWNYFLLARSNGSMASQRNNIYFSQPSETSPVTSSFIYTDRSVYRPLQKILFKVVAYSGNASDGRFETAKAGTRLAVRLVDPNSKAVETKSVVLGSFGSAAGEFTVPAGRPLGSWSIQVEGRGGYSHVAVEEYKRPTFEASLEGAKDPLRLNHQAHLKGEAKYYFGLPVSNGRANWRVTRTEVFPWWWELWGFWRGDGGRRGGQIVASGAAEIKKDGAFAIDFLPEADERRKKEKELSYNFEVAVDVTDEGGETRSASRSFRLGFTALEATLSWETGFFPAGKDAVLHAHLSDLDGKAVGGKGHFRISRLDAPATSLPADLPRESQVGYGDFALPGDSLRARWETDFRWEAVVHAWKEGEKVAEGDLEHDAKGEASIPFHVPGKAGVYRLNYSAKDSFGAPVEAQRDFLVAGKEGGANLPLVLVAEDPQRKVGETARILVHSGLSNQPIEVEVYRSGKRVLRKEISSGNSLLEIPVTEADRGGFSVVASGLRDHQALRAETQVQVPWSDRELKLEFSTFRDQLRPGQKETFRITVKNYKGVPMEKGSAEVLAYMFDRSLDLFGPHSYPQVASNYPSRIGAPSTFFSLGQAQAWTLTATLPSGVSSPILNGDSISYYPSYGVGGPGGRGGRFGNRMMVPEGGMAMQDAAKLEERATAAPFAALAKKDASAQSAAAPAAPPPAPELRSNFAENAFFAPHLVLGSGGTVSAEFTAPDSVTGWHVFAHAITRDLRGGTVTRDTRTVKELMVRPYAPRFLREGDEAEVKVEVNNAGSSPMSGELQFEIEDNATGKGADFGVKQAKKSFRVEKNGSVTLSFPLRAPKAVGDYAFKVTARSGEFSDGERRPFPVLPSRMHLAQSRFVSLHDKDSKTLEFADLSAKNDPTRINEQMVVTVDAQLFYGVLQALPYLERYPYECVEQTLNRFLSSGIVSSVFGKYPAVAKMAKQLSARDTQLERFDAADPNRGMQLEETPWLQEAEGGKTDPLANVLNPEIAKAERDEAIAKLAKMQLPEGAFPWFQGGQPDPHMTLYVLMSLARALEFKVDIPQDLVVKGWAYLHEWMDGNFQYMLSHDTGWEEVTMLNFALSGYPSPQWTGGAFDEAYRKKLLDFSFKHWKEHSPLVKGYLALTLKRMGRESDAKLVWDSVMDSAKFSDELGTYWAREDRSWLWYNDEIETHAFALRTQMELNPHDKRNEGMVQWLFLNKKLNHWKSTRATAEVIYSLTHYLDSTNGLGVPEEVRVDLGSQKTEFHFDPETYTGKKNQIVVSGPKVDSAARITVSKASKGFAFASATWAFSTDVLPAEDRGDFFQVSRRYFRRSQAGAEWTLTPLSEGAKIAVGDQIEVQLSLRTKHAAEYVHLRDPRGAGFEPESAVSSWKWDLGISWYEEVRDSGSNFFFSALPVGEYNFKYRLRANMAGTFRVGPATVQSMYAPEFNAYSAGNVLRVE
ncbi:MAG: alpha-2-macroglobulin family protein [Bdellovibrionota bacterium]